MTHIRNRLDIRSDLEEETLVSKKLPNYFLFDDELPHWQGFCLSVLAHVTFIALAFSLQVLVFSRLPKPQLPTRDVEFKLVQSEEKPPINKKTPIRSDRNSQAGGKHDPKRAVSEPGKTAKIAPAKQKIAQQKQQKAAPMKQAQNITKPKQQTSKPIQKPQAQKTAETMPVKKPAPISAPSALKPSVKPAIKPQSAPSAPKIAAAPKSPFTIPAAPNNAPVGSSYKTAGSKNASSSGGGSGASAGAPSPKFTSSGSGGSGGSSTGSKVASAGSYGARGSGGGLGSGNNPSPGNPSGTPGIDAIKQPNWGPYMRDLEQRIKRNWFPPKGDSSKRVVITFSIAKDGRLLSRKITKSSGVPLADQAALKAIESTAPFRPLPPEFKGASVPIEFTFDYNVLNSVLR